MLSNKQAKILGWVLLTPFIIFFTFALITVLITFPKLIWPLLFLVGTVVGLGLVCS